MWWHWHNHLHRDEFKETVSQPAQQESSYILNTSMGDETAGHVLYQSSSLTGDCAVVGRKRRRCWWENIDGDVQYSSPSVPHSFFFLKGELKGNEALGWGEEASEIRGCSRSRCCCFCCLPVCVNAKGAPLSIRVKFTWLQSGGPAGLRHGVNANLI